MRLFWVILLIFCIVSCSYYVTKQAKPADQKQETTDTPIVESTAQPITLDSLNRIELPKLRPKDELIEHLGFALVYSEPHEQALWVAYELTLDETTKAAERKNKFLPDPKVSTLTANDKDYYKSGYDRGHLAPAADMSWSVQALAESFYYSNISPQNPSFNRGVWKRLEELLRKWAVLDTALYVVTGPVLSDSLPTIGENQVSVPAYYYKVVLVYRNTIAKGIGFILPNQASNLPLTKFAISIDSVQKVTGIDFFHLLPDDLENRIESDYCEPCWSWSHQN